MEILGVHELANFARGQVHFSDKPSRTPWREHPDLAFEAVVKQLAHSHFLERVAAAVAATNLDRI